MKSIASIFEGIFSQDEQTIGVQAAIYDKNSSFWTGWASQFSDSSNLEFRLDNHVLNVDGKGLYTFRVDLKHPISNYIPDVQKTVFDKEVLLNLHGKTLDPSFFGKTIRTPTDTVRVENAPHVDGITFQTEETSIQYNGCELISNCEFDGTDRIFISNDKGYCKLQHCSSDSVEVISFESANAFKFEWKELADIIDWGAIDAPIDLNNARPVDLSKKSIVRLASIIKYMYKYSWHGHYIIPLKGSKEELIKKLFQESDFPKLDGIFIKGRDVTLHLDFRANSPSCHIQSKNFHGSRSRRFKR